MKQLLLWTRRAARWGAVGACLAGLLGACAAVPSQEMSDARRAVDAAAEAGAEQWAPNAMTRASGALDRASAALRAGDYDEARAMAGTARAEGIEARLLAEAVQDAEEAIAQARAAGRPWQGASELLEEARRVSREGATARARQIARQAVSLAR